MKTQRFALTLLLLVSSASFASRIDLSAHTYDLVGRVRKSFPIEDRYFDEEENRLLVRGDHEIVLADPKTIARAELIGLNAFLKGWALDSGLRLELRGAVVLRGLDGEVIDLEDPHTRAGREGEERAVMMEKVYRMLEDPNGGTRMPGLASALQSSKRFEQYTFTLSDLDDLDLGALPTLEGAAESREDSNPDRPKWLDGKFVLLDNPSRVVEFVVPTSPRSERAQSIVDHVLGYYETSAVFEEKDLAAPVELWVRPLPGKTPEDLARESIRHLGRNVREINSPDGIYLIEIDDQKLAPDDRVRFRRELRLMLDNGLKDHNRSVPGSQIRVRYTVSADHTCDLDLLR